MKKWIFVLVMVLICACQKTAPLQENEIGSEKLDNAEIVSISGQVNNRSYTRYEIRYEYEGKELGNYFRPEIRDAFDWINENTEEDALFMNWWDYGHMIRGYTGRDVLLFSPSEEIMYTIANKKWDQTKQGEFASHEVILDVIDAFITNHSGTTKDIMEKYSADYVFVSKQDAAIVYTFLAIKGINPQEYFTEDYRPKAPTFSFVIMRMIEEEEMDGFDLVYSDENSVIYKLE